MIKIPLRRTPMINKIPQYINAIVNHWMFIGALVLSHTTSMSVWIPVCLFAFTARALLLESIRLKQYTDWANTNDSEIDNRVDAVTKAIKPLLEEVQEEVRSNHAALVASMQGVVRK